MRRPPHPTRVGNNAQKNFFPYLIKIPACIFYSISDPDPINLSIVRSRTKRLSFKRDPFCRFGSPMKNSAPLKKRRKKIKFKPYLHIVSMPYEYLNKIKADIYKCRLFGADTGIRTRDLVLTKEVL